MTPPAQQGRSSSSPAPRPGWQFCDLLRALGVGGKVRGGPDRWTGSGWSFRELDDASCRVGQGRVSSSAWQRFVADPKPGEVPYLGSGKPIPAMAATLRYLAPGCVDENQLWQAWYAAKGVPNPLPDVSPPGIPPNGGIVLKFGASPADVLQRMLEAAGTSEQRVTAVVGLVVECLSLEEQGKLLASLALRTLGNRKTGDEQG